MSRRRPLRVKRRHTGSGRHKSASLPITDASHRNSPHWVGTGFSGCDGNCPTALMGGVKFRFHEVVYEKQKPLLAIFCKSAYTSVQPVPPKGRFAHFVTLTWRGLRWTLRRQAGCLPDETLAAYGEMVWSWRRDPGATLLVRPSELRGQERPLPGKSTYKP